MEGRARKAILAKGGERGHIIRSMLNLSASGRGWMILGLALVMGSGRGWCAEAESISAAPETGWSLVADLRGVQIFTRPHAGSAHKEFKAIGVIAAPPSAVNELLNDTTAYADFMPYTIECRVLRRMDGAVIEYQRIAPPLCSQRDYTLRIEESVSEGKSGTVYRQEWEPAKGEGPPAQKGIVRVTVCEGSWVLEPRAAGGTLATYRIFSDTGGALPAFIVNKGSQMAIPRIFEAIRKQVKNPKYAVAP